ncbi:tocopherol cyclase [Klebsormidium nitens]|uniref:Tocopherol cyclase n=1 Tax=Klebsormidium nitens TaxID=105231 RepID=A0A1Y1ILE1_KLENI|nr:tocopherol cyclase [Klebsormidium nitens]|eukprot:GAQ89951.1 tocopherol cyclase [Klebsormidium nitens]
MQVTSSPASPQNVTGKGESAGWGNGRLLPTIESTRTPHSGYHFDGSSRRFFEGWYFRVSIPEVRQSFAFMYSIEDPAGRPASLLSLGDKHRFSAAGAQILGPDDEYICQYETDVSRFWASKRDLSLGNTFRATPAYQGREPLDGPTSTADFSARVADGFQITPTFHQGHIRHNNQPPNGLEEWRIVPEVSWDYQIRPIYGWGDTGAPQKATAGWLAALPVFEPHWQVNLAHGLASGWLQWGERRFVFQNAPAYAEKNWGGAFPLRWFWVQCNVFNETDDLAITAGGGRRGLPLLPDVSEEVAMLGVHHQGRHYEFIPWVEDGSVSWEIEPWGRWHMTGKRADYEIEILATTSEAGCVLRAPTVDKGLAPFCRDTFFGQLELTIWERKGKMRGKVIVHATSSMCALEVGGGPWWQTWKKTARYEEPVRSLMDLPLGNVLQAIPPNLQPPGL